MDMKFDMTLWTTMLRRCSMPKKSDKGKTKLRYNQFCDVTSRDFGAKKINVWKFVQNKFVKLIARKLHKIILKHFYKMAISGFKNWVFDP